MISKKDIPFVCPLHKRLYPSMVLSHSNTTQPHYQLLELQGDALLGVSFQINWIYDQFHSVCQYHIKMQKSTLNR